MTRDDLVASALVLSFASLATAHVTLVASIAARRPRWRALVALVVAPLAPYWGYTEQARLRAAVWVASAALYIAFRVLASR